MPKFIISAALIVLLLLTACSGATPVQEGTGPAVPTVIAPTVSAQVQIPTPTPADSPIQVAPATPAARLAKPSFIEPTGTTAPAPVPTPTSLAPTPSPTMTPTLSTPVPSAAPTAKTPVPTPASLTPTLPPTVPSAPPTPVITATAPVPTLAATSARPPEAGPNLMINVAHVSRDITKYSRSHLKHWVDEEGDCQNAR